MSALRWILLIASLGLSHGCLAVTASGSLQPTTPITPEVVSDEVCPHDDPYSSLDVAKYLRRDNRFAAAIICDLRAYGACMTRSGSDHGDCDIIGRTMSDDLGLRSGDIVEALNDVLGPGNEELFVKAIGEARLFVATLKAELGSSSTRPVPVRVIEGVDVLDRRVEKIAMTHIPPVPSNPPVHPDSHDPPRVRPRAALFGTGIGSLTVGTGLAVAGVTSWGASREGIHAARNRLTEPATSDDDIAAELRAAERSHERTMHASIAIISVGASAMAAGVALLMMGALRERQGRTPPPIAPRRSLTPAVGRGFAGVAFSTRF